MFEAGQTNFYIGNMLHDPIPPGAVLASTTQGTNEDIDVAVGAAKTAYETWSKTSPHVRARHLYR